MPSEACCVATASSMFWGPETVRLGPQDPSICCVTASVSVTSEAYHRTGTSSMYSTAPKPTGEASVTSRRGSQAPAGVCGPHNGTARACGCTCFSNEGEDLARAYRVSTYFDCGIREPVAPRTRLTSTTAPSLRCQQGNFTCLRTR